MWNKQSLLRRTAIRAGTALAALIVGPTVALSQGAASDLDLESEDAVIPHSSSARAESCPDVLALHRARAAGDDATMRRIESRRAEAVSRGPDESAGGTTLLPVTISAGPGVPPGVDSGDSGIQAGDPPFCGGDVRVRSTTEAHAEFSHCMASTSTGELYLAWQDTSLPYDYIQIHHSSDGGASWSPFSYVMHSFADLQHPSIAVGEGSKGNTVILVFIIDDGSGFTYPHVVSFDMATLMFTDSSIPVWGSWEGYDRPVVTTDSCKWSSWYAYLTCEGIFDSSVDNVNVCTWRSSDGAVTWGDVNIPFGSSDGFAWVDPDISYGTTLERPFLVTYREDDYTIYTRSSSDFAVTWNATVPVATQAVVPLNDTDPEIAAAIDHDHVMMVCTAGSSPGGSGDNIGYSYSMDAGATWSFFWVLPGCSEYDDFAAALTANEGGESWHLAFTSARDQSVRYVHRPQDLSSVFQSGPWIVDDMGTASAQSSRARKGIASNWSTDRACIAWADFRDGGLGNYDTFADFEGNTGLMSSRRMVYLDAPSTVDLHLNAGVANAGRLYILTGTFAGTDPGTWLPGGLVKLPLNIDVLSWLCLAMGAPVFVDFIGTLDAAGTALAQIDIPADVGLLPGQIMHYAYSVMSPWDYASNAVMIRADY